METIKNNFIKKGYAVSVFDNRQDAVKYLNKNIDGVTVGIGGSMTVKELGLYDSLIEHNKVYWHWENNSGLSAEQVFKNAAQADIYLVSANGVSKTGEIVNIDGACNRVSASVFGHKKVYIIIGVNKIVDTCEQAVFRARNTAAPKNAARLNRNTPCAAKGNKCYDCNSPERICRNLSVLWTKPTGCEFEIVIINEKLGY